MSTNSAGPRGYFRSGSRTMMNMRWNMYATGPAGPAANLRSVIFTSDARWPNGIRNPAYTTLTSWSRPSAARCFHSSMVSPPSGSVSNSTRLSSQPPSAVSISRLVGTASGVHRCGLPWVAVRSRWKFDVSCTSIMRSRLLSEVRTSGLSWVPSALGNAAGGDAEAELRELGEVARPDRADRAEIRGAARRRSGSLRRRARACRRARARGHRAGCATARSGRCAPPAMGLCANAPLRVGRDLEAPRELDARLVLGRFGGERREHLERHEHVDVLDDAGDTELVADVRARHCGEGRVESEPGLERARRRLHPPERDQLRGRGRRHLGASRPPGGRAGCGR